MGLEKAIRSGHEHRKPYVGCKAADSSCRNHGSCSWCLGNRMHGRLKAEKAADLKIKEYKEE